MPFYAGFDLGGTQLKYGLINEDMDIIFHESVDTPENIIDLIALIKICWENLKKGADKPVASVGFGFPGIFSTVKQKILQSPNYPGIDNFDLLSALSEFIKVPFIVGNDANMAAFGEYKAGAGKGAHSMILLTIGTGVGGGVVLEGKLWQGSGGFAGEIGHVIVNPEGRRTL
jgi:glucokinase